MHHFLGHVVGNLFSRVLVQGLYVFKRDVVDVSVSFSFASLKVLTGFFEYD